MIGIIGAMPEEISTIVKEIVDLVEDKTDIRTFYRGKINNHECIVALAGIGKVNAAITTALLIEKYKVDVIINIGVAGGLNGVKHKDVVISREVLYHDVDVSKFGTYVFGQIPGSKPLFYADKSLLDKTIKILEDQHFSFKVGKIASGDQFVYQSSKIENVKALYSDIYAVEMEAAAIAHTATIYQVPFIIYRSISDLLDDENQHNDFNMFLHDAAEKATVVLKELIKNL
ncbi:MAG: 5'-methylthioadenosine/adenosylhomocysteine nucleosidase [Bacilli bacterium]|nr:5'-methylthioadenosine/adenosylhomocysteine nucleosidase [Bacilli bacterium]